MVCYFYIAMIHPDTEVRFISNEIGYGVVATKFIPKGTITWALDKLDRIYSPIEIEALDSMYKDILSKYTFRDNRGYHILCWDNSRYVNHSFNSNCISTAYDFEIAVRDIQPGEELTDDYGYLNVTEPFPCLPEKGTRRKMVNPDDLEHYHKQWDKKLLSAFKYLPKVDQPLVSLLGNDVREKAYSIGQGKQQMDSILNIYYKEK